MLLGYWKGTVCSGAPPMLLWPPGLTLELGVWGFLVWTLTCKVSLLLWASALTGSSHSMSPSCFGGCKDVLGSPGSHTIHHL